MPYKRRILFSQFVNDDILLRSLIISASLGALIGLVRQWEDQQENDRSLAGMRTFALWGMMGVASAFLQQEHFPYFFITAFGAVALYLAVSQLGAIREGKTPGFTTFTVALLTFIVGGLVYLGSMRVAVVLAVAMIILIASKEEIHGWTKHFTQKDIRSALVFAAITGIVLPLVPNKGYGPLQAFNPFATWLMVVLISGLGFVGYVLMRLLGARAGIAVTGLAGGLASSTAATIAFSRRSADSPKLSSSFALAIVLACTVMLGRVAVVVAMLDFSLFMALLPWLVVLALPGSLYAAWTWRFRRNPEAAQIETPDISNPLSLSMAFKFAAIYAVVVYLVKAVTTYGTGGSGIYWVTFISGLTDMDAITLSLSQMSGKGSLLQSIAAKAIILAAVSNTLLKLAFALAAGSRDLRREMLASLGVTLLIGVIALLVM